MKSICFASSSFLLGKALSPSLILPVLFVALSVVVVVAVVKGVQKKGGLPFAPPSALQKLSPMASNPLAHLLAEAAVSKFDSTGKVVANSILNGMLNSIGLGALTIPADTLAGTLEKQFAGKVAGLGGAIPPLQGVKPIIIPGGLPLAEQLQHLLAQGQ